MINKPDKQGWKRYILIILIEKFSILLTCRPVYTRTETGIKADGDRAGLETFQEPPLVQKTDNTVASKLLSQLRHDAQKGQIKTLKTESAARNLISRPFFNRNLSLYQI